MPNAEPHPTKHALETMTERDITWGEVQDVILKPEVTYGPDRSGRTVMQRGKISVVVARDMAVITVLLRQEEQWTNADARSR